jgi:hypothetical protein
MLFCIILKDSTIAGNINLYLLPPTVQWDQYHLLTALQAQHFDHGFSVPERNLHSAGSARTLLYGVLIFVDFPSFQCCTFPMQSQIECTCPGMPCFPCPLCHTLSLHHPYRSSFHPIHPSVTRHPDTLASVKPWTFRFSFRMSFRHFWHFCPLGGWLRLQLSLGSGSFPQALPGI